ncbi:hypothetical protein A3C59_05200 [Candidatus Daviesbacteria bacterium RIFCSPHIGHO2_02_FULL_36_13]|uniref:Uncharacterized protein n=1 Tax=Candidatus Daviesbacteria bacterium RIFCSPHIGHO2_02_FULL_36_13 TaxID=1797768 RepID=A0A1F5JUP4_9BACT|nr:MAG: hypothetical protein A3C59_05200 [Candidatus Daviesbacteria bacterium RIFCSPHIGHO2_02_FULL_36_13]OGE44576.1 MAG: hypothetical protein A3A45_02945 [Candidatus Daviesbacteria bacterium RIFCSPLOWO2_01_FULL_36_8]
MNTNRANIQPIHIMKVLVASIIMLSIFGVTNAYASGTRCETQYGGKQVCVTTGQLQVNKEVFDPKNNKHVDNLGINDFKFAPSDLISFRISVKNVGDATINKVMVTDTPQAGFLELATGSLNYEITDLKPGETKSQEIKLRVVDASKMPQNNTICVINAVEAKSEGMSDRDTAQVCLERKVLAVQTKELPKTGPADWLFTLFGSSAGLFAGAKLRGLGKRETGLVSNYQLTENMVSNKSKEVNI